MKKLALLVFTLFSVWNMDAKTITGPVDYVSPLVGTQSKQPYLPETLIPYRPSLGNELLGSPDPEKWGMAGHIPMMPINQRF